MCSITHPGILRPPGGAWCRRFRAPPRRADFNCLHKGSRQYSGGAHQETICLSSGYSGFLCSARCAVTSRSR
eukprot:202442-Pyramimonas_sp.AAC.1